MTFYLTRIQRLNMTPQEERSQTQRRRHTLTRQEIKVLGLTNKVNNNGKELKKMIAIIIITTKTEEASNIHPDIKMIKEDPQRTGNSRTGGMKTTI